MSIPPCETGECFLVAGVEHLEKAVVLRVEAAAGIELTAAQIELRARFAEGLVAYRAQRWEEARRCFEAAILATPGDGPSLTFIQRIEKLAFAPPGENWDGSWHLERK
jgi:hypothetical protein